MMMIITGLGPHVFLGHEGLAAVIGRETVGAKDEMGRKTSKMERKNINILRTIKHTTDIHALL